MEAIDCAENRYAEQPQSHGLPGIGISFSLFCLLTSYGWYARSNHRSAKVLE